MRPTLKNPRVADEDLIEAMNMAMSAETERINKFSFSGRTKPVSVSALEMVNEKTKEKREEGRILAALKTVQSDLTTLKTEMTTLRDSVTKVQEPAHIKQDGKPAGQPKRGCKECQEKGVSDTCAHCFLSGGSNHIARHCQLKYKNQGNRKGLPPRDWG